MLLKSPFLSHRRISLLRESFSWLITRGVLICAFVQKPSDWGDKGEFERKFFELNELVEMLRSIGVHVTLVPLIHEKLAVIDDFALWDGSLNLLSHSRTKERMHRFTSVQEIGEAIMRHVLDQCSICLTNYELHVLECSPRGMAKQLERFRKERRLSQGELAKRCRLSQSYISQLEQGSKCNIHLDTLYGISQVLEIEPVLVPKKLIPAVTKLLHDGRC